MQIIVSTNYYYRMHCILSFQSYIVVIEGILRKRDMLNTLKDRKGEKLEKRFSSLQVLYFL